MSDVSATSLPFREQAEFWRRKVNIPTATWRDLQREDHAHGFMVAGASRVDLLDDLRKAIDKAIYAGATIADFRKDFDAIVARTGWQYKGGRNWRTRIIYDTNLRSSYQAGRWQQMQAIKHRRPWWVYVHHDCAHPRPMHLAWNGTILHADDPWWSTHFTPNGYGCHCTVDTLAQRDMDDMGKTGPDEAPTAVDDTTGLDPGFDYNVGTAASSMPAAARFGQRVMTLPPAWRDAALTDAQQHPAAFADWPAAVRRVDATQPDPGAVPQATSHPLGFMRPPIATALQGGKVGELSINSPGTSTALLGAEDATIYQALRSGKGDDAPIIRAAIEQLPQWLASASTTALWDTTPGKAGLVYAQELDDGDWIKAVFAVEAAAERDSVMRQARLAANWLQSVGIVSADSLRDPRYVKLSGIAHKP